MVDRVVATPAALELICQLMAAHGEVMFHQSGGCCENSAPNCFLPSDLTIGAQDVLLGHVGGAPFYIGRAQYEYWKHTQIILDVVDGYSGTFSLESATGKTFHTRSRLFSDDEWAQLCLAHPTLADPPGQRASA